MMNSLKSFMYTYIKDFSKGDVKYIVPYYDFPLTIVDQTRIENNVISSIKNKKQFKNYFNKLYKVLKIIYGYKKSKVIKIQLKNKKKNCISVKMIVSRLNYKNEKFQKLELTYYVKKIKNEYKFFCFVV
jgi:hypothetical protein